MDFVTETYISQQDLRRFTAPTGKIYEVWGFAVTNLGVKTTQLMIINKYVEEEVAVIERGSNPMFVFDCGIDGSNMVVILPKPIKTKYITMGPSDLADLSLVATIYYTIVPASKPELIWEFIRRGKNP